MTKPKPIKSHNPKDVEFYARGWNEGQAELEQAVCKWIDSQAPGDDSPQEVWKPYGELRQSLLSAMEHS